MTKVLHLLTDDKFAKFVYQEFSKAENAVNQYLCVSSDKELKHIDFACDKYWNGNTETLQQLINEYINNFDIVVIHFLSENAQKIISKLNKSIKVVWIGWGGDYYWLIDTLPEFNMFSKQTADHLKSKNSNLIKRIKKITRINKFRALQRIDYFSPVLKSEFDLVKSNYPGFHPKYIEWNYGNLQENYIKGYEDFQITGKDLLIGNSATPTNNHLDVFETLESYNAQNFFEKIYLPLGYGDPLYKEFISSVAVEKFGSKVQVISDFLPYDQYLKILKDCDNVIMGHVRQQAMGNIITLLYLGAKLYFPKESIVYQDLKSKGYSIYTLDDISDEQLTKTSLDYGTITHHRELLNKEWSKDANNINTKRICSL